MGLIIGLCMVHKLLQIKFHNAGLSLKVPMYTALLYNYVLYPLHGI